MSEKKVLTKEIAEQFLENPESVDLNEFTSIDLEAKQLFEQRGYSLAPDGGPGRQRGLENTFPYEPIDFGESVLRGIPGCYYFLAIVCGVVLTIFAIVVSGDLDAAQTGALIGWIIGAVLAMLATGRLVGLVQRISDDVRIIRDRNGPEAAVDKRESELPGEDKTSG